MRAKFLFLILFLSLPVEAIAMTGTGSKEDPYIITTSADMKLVETDISKYYKLSNDIDLQGNDNNQWTPIGFKSPTFRGTFDGNGHTISGLYINSTDTGNFGLFGTIHKDGTVKNLSVSGDVANSYTYTSTNVYVGGLAGKNEGNISNCYISVNVEGINAGGVVGMNVDNAMITDCLNTGNVRGGRENYPSIGYAGGIAGMNQETITNCYNIGNVSIKAGSLFGGVVGINENGTTIKGTVSDCYYLENNAATVGIGATKSNNADNPIEIQMQDISGKAESLTEEQFKSQDSFQNWDFINTWIMGNEKPMLRIFVRHVHEWEITENNSSAVIKCKNEYCPYTTNHEYTVKIEAALSSKTYDGTAITAFITSSDGFPSEINVSQISYVGREGTDYSNTAEAPIIAGKYTASASISDGINARNISFNYEINPAEINEDMITLASVSHDYDGTEKSPVIASERPSATMLGLIRISRPWSSCKSIITLHTK